MKLEDLQPEASVRGISPFAAVFVVSVTLHALDTLALTYDVPAARFRGLRRNRMVIVASECTGLLEKPEIAGKQLGAETLAPIPQPASRSNGGASVSPPELGSAGIGVAAPAPRPRRFYGSLRLDPQRVGRDAGRIAEEIISHFAGQDAAKVTVTLEVEARLPNGASDQIVRAVTATAGRYDSPATGSRRNDVAPFLKLLGSK